MTAGIRVIFKLPGMPPVYYKPNHLVIKVAQRFFAPKLALLVILPINNYNYNINSINITDQLWGEMSIYYITRQLWFLYWF
jgi:hypothetical protein